MSGEDDDLIVCDGCGEKFEMWELSYIGPVDPKIDKCSPFMKFFYYCPECDPHADL